LAGPVRRVEPHGRGRFFVRNGFSSGKQHGEFFSASAASIGTPVAFPHVGPVKARQLFNHSERQEVPMYDYLEEHHDPEVCGHDTRTERSNNFSRIRPPKASRGNSNRKKAPAFGGMRLRRNKRWNW